DVAIKRVRVASGDPVDGRYSERFFNAEAALVGRLEHPNVVQIYDAVVDPEGAYLVMEYVNGCTLRPYCRADQLLSLELIVEVGFKCAMALGYVFRQGLIHRDVKPANLLVVLHNGAITDVKITDFGSVLNLDSDVTQVYRVGSLAYMSPEQLDGSTLDCRADMYSLGAVLYHLISGRPPFDAQQQSAMMNQIYNQEPVPLTGLRSGLGEAGRTFHIIAQGELEVFRDGQQVAQLGAGTSVGEMAYLAPSPDLRRHSTDVVVTEPTTTISFTPETLAQVSPSCRHHFDEAFIRVLVRRLHAAHEALAHPRRIL